ncbi:ribbon-helix-helix protein, CopG family [Vulcanococcus limneticus]|uniref:ribbon-helix-helix protein, CopG family n=1 Tax=Vulcanococcus limneticus TaxID=2170428 RepID=UPI00398C1343
MSTETSPQFVSRRLSIELEPDAVAYLEQLRVERGFRSRGQALEWIVAEHVAQQQQQ